MIYRTCGYGGTGPSGAEPPDAQSPASGPPSTSTKGYFSELVQHNIPFVPLPNAVQDKPVFDISRYKGKTFKNRFKYAFKCRRAMFQGHFKLFLWYINGAHGGTSKLLRSSSGEFNGNFVFRTEFPKLTCKRTKFQLIWVAPKTFINILQSLTMLSKVLSESRTGFARLKYSYSLDFSSFGCTIVTMDKFQSLINP